MPKDLYLVIFCLALTPLQLLVYDIALIFFFGLGFTLIVFIFMSTLDNECSSAAFALNTTQLTHSKTKCIKKECGNYTKRNIWQETEEMT
jgi:hypothetical protein